MRQTKTFLLVEDDGLDAEFVRSEFKSAAIHAQLQVVSDGAVAVDYVTAKGRYADRNKYPLPDVIVLDLEMPRIDGFGFLVWLRTQAPMEHRLIPVVVMTSSDTPEDVTRAYAAGANSYIVKPVNLAQFRERLCSLGLYWAAHTETPKGHGS